MHNEDIIVKYLAGEAEEHEIVMLENWRKESEQNELEFIQFERIWKSSIELRDKREFNADAAWSKVNERISKGKVVSFRSPVKSIWFAAASFIILFAVSVLLYNLNTGNQEKMLTASVSGHPLDLKLNDGSTVLLQSGDMDYPETFKGEKRKVTLNTGTAYFRIHRDTTRPFEITANNTTITVLGTEFEVSTDPKEVRVKVQSGKVRFTTPSGEKVMLAGESAVYKKTENEFKTFMSKPDNSLSYATRNLEFDNETLEDVVKDLNRTYEGAEIQLDSAVAGCRMTASFQDEKLSNILNIIQATMRVEIRKDKVSGKYRIGGTGCQTN